MRKSEINTTFFKAGSTQATLSSRRCGATLKRVKACLCLDWATPRSRPCEWAESRHSAMHPMASVSAWTPRMKPRARQSSTIARVLWSSTHSHATLWRGSATNRHDRSPQTLMCEASHLNNGNLWEATSPSHTDAMMCRHMCSRPKSCTFSVLYSMLKRKKSLITSLRCSSFLVSECISSTEKLVEWVSVNVFLSLYLYVQKC